MKIKGKLLDEFIYEVACECFGTSVFGRKLLIESVVAKAKQLGLWTIDDERPSKGARNCNTGFAAIDNAISYPKKPGLIVNVGRNQWKVSTDRNYIQKMASDISEPPERASVIVNRIIRDTTISKLLKLAYDHKCQICGISLYLDEYTNYAEAHHIKPLGGVHMGFDSPNNMLVLCPNHHAQFDFGVPKFASEKMVVISGKEYELTMNHSISKENIDYYNNHICSEQQKV